MYSWLKCIYSYFASWFRRPSLVFDTLQKKTVCQLVNEQFPCYKFIRSDKDVIRNGLLGLCCLDKETITLAKKEGMDTFLHELGHVMYYNTYKELHKCYTEEAIVELFSWLVLFEGSMKKAFVNTRQGWPESMIGNIMDYENVSWRKAKKLKRQHGIRADWTKARKYALKLWNTPFGQELTRIIKDGAEIGF